MPYWYEAADDAWCLYGVTWFQGVFLQRPGFKTYYLIGPSLIVITHSGHITHFFNALLVVFEVSSKLPGSYILADDYSARIQLRTAH
jgi:hypothetical protein